MKANEDLSSYNNKWVYTPKKITFWRSLGYAVNDMNGGAWGTLIGSYLTRFAVKT